MNITVTIVQMHLKKKFILELNLTTRDNSTTTNTMIEFVNNGSQISKVIEEPNAIIVHTISIMQHARSIKELSVNSVRRVLL